jgi:hypothetical protein
MLATEAGARDLRATDRPEARHAGVNCATARTINPIFATKPFTGSMPRSTLESAQVTLSDVLWI